MMKKWIVLALFVSLLSGGAAFAFTISPQDANKIAEKIWKNECGGALEELTHWKKGENFASLGIGHFIWYCAGKRERFEETFPSLLVFLEQKGVILPSWLKKAQGCPWNSREEFYQKIQSTEMQSLRQMLFETRNLQAIFIVNRLEKTVPELVQNLSPTEKERVMTNFNRLAKEVKGLYALIDYLNFKGSGTLPMETYQGKGWGLLQVLLRMDPLAPDSVADFIQSAKAVLSQRVQNAPPERNEERWLQGWFNRLDAYHL